jgi:enoyl-CoA hydratase/carnithine racemase
MNTLSADTLEALGSSFRSLDGARAVILTGAGGESFAAGANIGEIAEMTSAEAVSFAALGQSVLGLIEASRHRRFL